jgi:hypothetical protein
MAPRGELDLKSNFLLGYCGNWGLCSTCTYILNTEGSDRILPYPLESLLFN